MNRVASCYCENLKVEVEGEPEFSWGCHCDNCQRMTGSVGQFIAAFKNEAILKIEGKGTLFEAPAAQRYFCSNCGATVYSKNEGLLPDYTLISVGCFADPNFPAPLTVTYTNYRHAWCQDILGAQMFKASAQGT